MANINRIVKSTVPYLKPVWEREEELKQEMREAVQAGVLWGGQKNPPYVSPPAASINEGTGSYTVQNSAYSAYMAELERQRAERQRMLDAQYNQGKKNIRDTARASNKQAYV